MILMTDEIRAALVANAAQAGDLLHDPVPVIKFFNPFGAATLRSGSGQAWLATELYEDGDTLFGLADLGFGCPELGTFSLHEIASIRLPYGLNIERDIAFGTPWRLSIWAHSARLLGSILWAETHLRWAEINKADPGLPSSRH